jgi:hypothetical protein
MDKYIDREMMARIIAEMIVSDIMSTYPTSMAEKSPYTTENRICADIELDDEELDKGYYKSMSTRKYKDDAN